MENVCLRSGKKNCNFVDKVFRSVLMYPDIIIKPWTQKDKMLVGREDTFLQNS